MKPVSLFPKLMNLPCKYVNDRIFPPAATELVDQPASTDGQLDQDGSGHQMTEAPSTEQQPEGQLHPDGLLSEMEALTCRMTPLELSRCSPQQLVQMHDQLGGMMRRVVVELQTRLCQTDAKP